MSDLTKKQLQKEVKRWKVKYEKLRDQSKPKHLKGLEALLKKKDDVIKEKEKMILDLIGDLEKSREEVEKLEGEINSFKTLLKKPTKKKKETKK